MVNDLLDLEERHAKAQRAQRIHTEGVLAFFASWREPFRLSTTSLTSTNSVLYSPMVVGEFGSMATCEDPTGAAFGFWQAGRHVGSQVTDEPGSTTWYELYAANAKQARDFYTALLGATADPMPGGMEYYVLKHGEKMRGGIMQIDPTWGDFHPQWITYRHNSVCLAVRQRKPGWASRA